MLIEHLTLLGNSSQRDSNDIRLDTISLLKEFQIKEGSKILSFPRTEFQVKITSTIEGAVFDIMKNNQIAIVNICGFGENKKDLINLVRSLSKSVINTSIFREPDNDYFIYSVPIDPFCLTNEELSIAGEVELYIYYSLYLARKK